jgi:hypothetical protein
MIVLCTKHNSELSDLKEDILGYCKVETSLVSPTLPVRWLVVAMVTAAWVGLFIAIHYL